jgi:hypothetical protein
MMNTCKNCKYWGIVDEDDQPDGFPGGEDHKSCSHPKVGGGSYSDIDRMGKDALNSYESIGAGPDFGCIHFEING